MKLKRISKIDLFILTAGLIGFLIFLFFWSSAFPSASIDLKLSRDDALIKAKDFIQNENLLDLTGYESTVIFSSYTEAIDYIDSNFGIDMLNKIAKEELPVWMWSVRYFKPLEIEEIFISIDPSNGKVVSFGHILPEDSPGADLEQDEAILIAESFLLSQNVNLSDYDLIVYSSEKREARTDHFFEWEKKNYTIGEATLRLQVDVYGDKVGYYEKYLKIPEEILREASKQFSYGVLLT